MSALLVLAMSALGFSDPVSGDVLHWHKPGEHAVVHLYDDFSKKAFREVEAWIELDALIERTQRNPDDSLLAKWRAKGIGGFIAEQDKWTQETFKSYVVKRKALYLPDMTKVEVMATAAVIRTESDLPVQVPDHVYAKVLEGPMKGKHFWINSHGVRVPGSKPPVFNPDPINEPADTEPEAAPVAMKKEEAIEPAPALRPWVLLEDSNWNRLAETVQVHARIKNESQLPLEGLRGTISYFDKDDNLVASGQLYCGDIEVGDTKTVSGLDKYDEAMHHYKIEFESRYNGKVRSIDTIRAEKIPPLTKPKRRTRR